MSKKNKNPRTITIKSHILDEIRQTIGSLPAESGGILGSNDGGRTITHYYFDRTATTTSGTYTPDTDAINKVIEGWEKNGIQFVGFIHSHPGHHSAPSSEDHRYGIRIMNAMDMKGCFFMPIVNVSNPPEGNIEIHPYVINQSRRLRKQPIILEQNCDKPFGPPPPPPVVRLPEDAFARIKTLYPLDVLKRKQIICIGCGGTRQFIEDLARSGAGNFVLIDGDTVSATNLATQHVYVSEIGRFKVDALRDRILNINPEANVTVAPSFLDDAISDADFESIVGDSLTQNPKDILICGCTDNFYAQARAAALAMKYGTPYLAGQLYQGGMAAEVYFSYPGVTNSSCPRCSLVSRYMAYANGYKNDVTSDGSPIFSTVRVNSIKGQIALMLLLYHEDATCTYNDMLDQVADRNFVMLRMSPLADISLNIGVFQEALNLGSGLCFFDETVWIPQAPNDGENGYPVCPMCGGSGDLLKLKGKIRDTRTDW